MAANPDEVAELYRLEREGVARSLGRMVDRDMAEDMVHDAFVAYLTRPPAADRPGAWIQRVAKNRALNEIRRATPVSLTVDPVDHREPSSDTGRDSVRALVAAALAALDERSRRVLVLRYYEEVSYEDIADLVGISRQQAHVVMHRAVRRLGREIIRRLAAAHDATDCVPALEQMAGLGMAANGHGPGPCPRCTAVADELAALRIAPALLPWLPGLLRRLVLESGARLPEIAEPLNGAISAVLALVIAVATAAGTPPRAVEATVHSAPAQVEAKASAEPASSARAVRRRPEPTGEQARERRTSTARDQAEPGPAVSRDGVTVRAQEESTQAEAAPDEIEGGGGAVVCKPLEPCPPPPE